MEHALSEPAPAVHLLVGNQSFEVDPVDIEVTVDGEVVASGEFSVEGDQPPQHNWRRYDLSLPAGEHVLSASSGRGSVRSEVVFDVPDVQTVTVAFWHGDRPGGGGRGGFFTVDAGGGAPATM